MNFGLLNHQKAHGSVFGLWKTKGPDFCLVFSVFNPLIAKYIKHYICDSKLHQIRQFVQLYVFKNVQSYRLVYKFEKIIYIGITTLSHNNQRELVCHNLDNNSQCRINQIFIILHRHDHRNESLSLSVLFSYRGLFVFIHLLSFLLKVEILCSFLISHQSE